MKKLSWTALEIYKKVMLTRMTSFFKEQGMSTSLFFIVEMRMNPFLKETFTTLQIYCNIFTSHILLN